MRQRQVNRQGQQNPGQVGLLEAGQDLAEQGKPRQQGNGHEQATAEELDRAEPHQAGTSSSASGFMISRFSLAQAD